MNAFVKYGTYLLMWMISKGKLLTQEFQKSADNREYLFEMSLENLMETISDNRVHLKKINGGQLTLNTRLEKKFINRKLSFYGY